MSIKLTSEEKSKLTLKNLKFLMGLMAKTDQMNVAAVGLIILGSDGEVSILSNREFIPEAEKDIYTSVRDLIIEKYPI